MALHAIKLQKPMSEADERRKAKEEELNATGHGGARDGAGRKPKALRYACELAEAENKIIAALPEVIDRLIAAAKAGDVAASRYLLDRVFGRVKEQAATPADDTALPYSAADLERDESKKAWRDRMDTW
jgi:hypothetical protein